MTKEEVIAAFGVDPDNTGNRPRGWWIIEKPDYEDERAGAAAGDWMILVGVLIIWDAVREFRNR